MAKYILTFMLIMRIRRGRIHSVSTKCDYIWGLGIFFPLLHGSLDEIVRKSFLPFLTHFSL